jgi:hypothetical protein
VVSAAIEELPRGEPPAEFPVKLDIPLGLLVEITITAATMIKNDAARRLRTGFQKIGEGSEGMKTSLPCGGGVGRVYGIKDSAQVRTFSAMRMASL